MNNEEWFLYGAGFNGIMALKLFESLQLKDKILGFIDYDIGKQNTIIHGIKVYPPNILNKLSNAIILITCGSKYSEEVAQNCVNNGINKFIFLDEIESILFEQYRYGESGKINLDYGRNMGWVRKVALQLGSNRFLIDFFVLSVGQACSLKCKNCGNFAPYSQMESLHYNLRDIIEDLKKVFSVVDYIFSLQIQGGEPFLYREIDELLLFLKTVNNLGGVSIATNGKHVPKDSFWNNASGLNLCIRVSNYPGYKAVLSEQLCRKKNVDYVLYEFAGNAGTWRSLGNESRIYDLQGKQSLDYRYLICPFRMCLSLEDGIIARCSRAVNASKVQGFKHRKGDVISIREGSDLRESLRKYYINPKAMTACLYCKGGEGEEIPPAEQL